MSETVHAVESPHALISASVRLRDAALRRPLDLQRLLPLLEQWGAALDSPETRDIPGVTFLRLWLRRGTLESILLRELGAEALQDSWRDMGRARLRTFPVGVVGHWPAGNIEIQPFLSMTCALLGGNSCLVRVPSALVQTCARILRQLQQVDTQELLRDRIYLVGFDHCRSDLHAAMAENVDGAMIWGGKEAVTEVRGLPFPHWAHIVVFGPRLSVAAMDAATWGDPLARPAWCRRIARDVWQFDQQACSSPQSLFLERDGAKDPLQFVEELKLAFEEENRAHPRMEIEPAQTSAIARSRADWLLNNVAHRATFPASPDWTILLGEGTGIPEPTQGRTLAVLVVDDLMDAIAGFDGTVQTLGVAVTSREREEALAETAGRHGVDRIVRLGQMHVFGSPWDGFDLVRPMTRLVRHARSQD